MSNDISSDSTGPIGCGDTYNSAVDDAVAETNIKKACTVVDDTELLAEDNANAGNDLDREPGGQPNQEIVDEIKKQDIAEAEKPTIEQLELEVSR